MDALNKESRIRKEKRKEQIEKLKTEQIDFLTRCQDLARQVIPVPEGVDIDRLFERAYQLFEIVMLSFQAQL